MPHAVLPDAPRVLIVLMGSLGDIVRAMPLAGIVKRHRPGARLSWVVGERWRELVGIHPAVDRLVRFPRVRTFEALRCFVHELRAERYDLALDLQRILKSGVCARFSGAPRRIGFHRANAKELNALFNNDRIGYRSEQVSKLQHYLAFAAHLQAPVPEPLDFGLEALREPRRQPDAVRNLGPGFLAMVLGSSWPTKDWTDQGYCELATSVVRETARKLVLLGDGSQRDRAARVVSAVPAARVVDLAGKTSVVELGATLAAARAVVGPDSGPGHLAAALGTPVVTLFGPTDIARVAPYRCEHLAVRTPVDCLGCSRHRCRRRAGRCMDALTAPMVWNVLRPLL